LDLDHRLTTNATETRCAIDKLDRHRFALQMKSEKDAQKTRASLHCIEAG